MNRSRPRQIVIRMNEEEFIKVKKQVEKSGLSQQEYLIRAILNKPIINTDGLKEIIPELKRQGNNLNQLTKLAHEGKWNCKNNLEEMDKEMIEVWQSLKQLIQK